MKQITFDYNGKEYTLAYTLRSAGLAEKDGFVIDKLGESPATMIPLLFHWSFYRYHKGITKKQTEEIYTFIRKKNELISALAEMYADAVNALVDIEDEDEGNANWTLA